MTLTDIERMTREYAETRGKLADIIQALQAEVEAVKRRRLAPIKRAVAATAEAHDRLRAAIEAASDLFVKPRSVVIAGVRVGFQKGRGELEIADAVKTVQLIRKHLPDQADVLIKTVETPVKSALATLPAADLKRIGVNVADAGDQVLIKPTDSDVDKLVAALLKDAERIEEEAA